MQCTSPLTAYQLEGGGVTFVRARGGDEILLPCGRCISCRIHHSQMWALRCSHEAKCHEQSAFVTLTYDDKHLPAGQTLVPDHFRLFMRRVRKRFRPVKVRFFGCGEYGDDDDMRHRLQYGGNLGRPHYHILLFGVSFSDGVQLSKKGNNVLYTSKLLSSLWPHGSSSFGAVTPESAGYVARYSLKKINGEMADAHYLAPRPFCDADTGEFFTHRRSEFLRMSRRPGVGALWFQRFYKDYIDGYCVVDGRRVPVPRYYKSKLDWMMQWDDHLQDRVVVGYKNREHNKPDRLAAKAAVVQSRISTLKRDL